MKRLKIPTARVHKSSGQLRCRHEGRDLYFGLANDPASLERFERWRAELLIQKVFREQTPLSSGAPQGPTVNEVGLAFLQHAETAYGKGNKPSPEFWAMRDALKPVKALYGSREAIKFGPLALRAVRERMIEHDLSRLEINKRITRIRRVFRWAASMELVPASIYEALRTVEGLEYGRTKARETAPVRPVSAITVEATLPFTSPQVAAMIQLQSLTGMRPGEVVQMRLCDIDRATSPWVYEPADHKTKYRNFVRQVPLGPRAQAVLQPFLDRPAEQHLFSPVKAEQWRNERRAEHRRSDRKSKVYPCELRARDRRKAKAKQRFAKRPKRDAYDVHSYRRAIAYAVDKAIAQGLQIEHWHPHQLRHTFATEVRRGFGLEGAQAALGHARADVTQIYAERNLRLAIQIADELG